MLRKTNYQRASMKRSKSENNNNNNLQTNVIYKSNETNNISKSRSSDFDFDNNENVLPVALPRKSANGPVPSDRKLSFGESLLTGGESFESIGTYVHEEIGPGIVLEGYAVEF